MLNPVRLYKAYRYGKKQPKYSKANKDLELMLYGKILKNDMLHYGYFDDPNVVPDTISIADVERAQVRYAEVLAEQVQLLEKPILDVGCGMGGLSNILNKRGLNVEALTPDQNQKKHIGEKYPDITCHHMKFEDFQPTSKFGTVINSESLQYIDLDKAFELVGDLLEDDGRWIITDYFRLTEKGKNKSGHTFEKFRKKIQSSGWVVEKEQDITPNCLPTLKLVNVYVERFLEPLAIFGVEKMKVKMPWLYYLTGDMRDAIAKKADKEMASVDPEKFANEKKYMLYVLKKPNA